MSTLTNEELIRRLQREVNDQHELMSELSKQSRYVSVIQDSDSANDLVQILQETLTHEGYPLDAVGILRPIRGSIVGKDAGLLQLMGATGVYAPFVGNVFPIAGTLSGTAYANGELEYVPETRHHENVHIPEGVDGEAAEYAIPVRAPEDSPLSHSGVLLLRRQGAYSFTGEDRMGVQRLTKKLDKTVREKLLLLSHAYDGGCPTIFNRAAGMRKLEQAYMHCVRNKTPFTLAFLDADNFKQKNDMYGHGTVDEALLAITLSITQHVRANDVVMRYGGDEFVIGLPGMSPSHAQKKLEAIAELVAQPSHLPIYQDHLSGRGYHIPDGLKFTFSAGLHGITSELRDHSPAAQLGLPTLGSLFALANENLYAAKDAGRNTIKLE